MDAVGSCEMLKHVYRNSPRHVADDRKIAQPGEPRISVYHTTSPRRGCLFRVTWIAPFLNQRLYHSCWRRLMISRRHLRVGRQTFTIFSFTPGSQQRGSYEGQWKSGNQAEASLIRQRLSVCVRTDVCEWKQFLTSDGLLGTYQQLFFVFHYVYSTVSLNLLTGWPELYIEIQSVPRSKHSPSRL
jgi:hypothetical protein